MDSDYTSSSDNSQKSLNDLSVSRMYEKGCTLAWRNLSVDVLVKSNVSTRYKRIINSVSGAVKVGSLVGILGASGSGKSTLLLALAHRPTARMRITGDVLINGAPIDSTIRMRSGYMYQDDLFVETLTVYEHLYITARLKLPQFLAGDLKSRIDGILVELSLMDRRDARIGNELSGGEKKRLAFAAQLVADAPLQWCDEPTTGLDSHAALKLITLMSRRAARGQTLLCAVHQPSADVLAHFGQLILLASGRVAFCGTVTQASRFFQRLGYTCPRDFNRAEFLVNAVAQGDVDQICEAFETSDINREAHVLLQYEFHPGRTHSQETSIPRLSLNSNKRGIIWAYQLFWLIYRNLLDCIRNPAIHQFRMLQKIGIAIIVGLCYLGTDALTQNGVQSIQGVLFILVAENTFTPMYTILSLFPNEFVLFQREYTSGLYSVPVYYLAKSIAILPGIILEAAIFAQILYYMSGLRHTLQAMSVTTATAILTMAISTACGCFFSVTFKSASNAMAYLVPFDVMLLITQGAFVQLSSLPIYLAWIPYMSWLMYSTEVMSIIQWDEVFHISCDGADSTQCLNNGNDVLDKYSFDSNNYYRDLFALLALFLLFHVLTFISINFRIKH